MYNEQTVQTIQTMNPSRAFFERSNPQFQLFLASQGITQEQEQSESPPEQQYTKPEQSEPEHQDSRSVDLQPNSSDNESQSESQYYTPPEVIQKVSNKAKSPMTIIVPPLQPEDSSSSSQDTDKVVNIAILRSCKCDKSKCLKLYCLCFHDGLKCGKECVCKSCKNSDDFQEERKQAIKNVFGRAKKTNNPKDQKDLFNTKKVDNCNCKTNCLQEYCECHKLNQKCTQKCNCDICENGKDDDFQLPQKIEKRIRKFRV